MSHKIWFICDVSLKITKLTLQTYPRSKSSRYNDNFVHFFSLPFLNNRACFITSKIKPKNIYTLLLYLFRVKAQWTVRCGRVYLSSWPGKSLSVLLAPWLMLYEVKEKQIKPICQSSSIIPELQNNFGANFVNTLVDSKIYHNRHFGILGLHFCLGETG